MLCWPGMLTARILRHMAARLAPVRPFDGPYVREVRDDTGTGSCVLGEAGCRLMDGGCWLRTDLLEVISERRPGSFAQVAPTRLAHVCRDLLPVSSIPVQPAREPRIDFEPGRGFPGARIVSKRLRHPGGTVPR